MITPPTLLMGYGTLYLNPPLFPFHCLTPIERKISATNIAVCCSFVTTYCTTWSFYFVFCRPIRKQSVLRHNRLGLLSNLWVVSTRVLPLSRISVKLFHTWRLANGSTPVVGSSRKTIDGLPISAMPTLNLRLLPPLNIDNKLCYTADGPRDAICQSKSCQLLHNLQCMNNLYDKSRTNRSNGVRGLLSTNV